MPWSDLEIDPARIRGLAERRLRDRRIGEFDEGKITPEREEAAKDLVWRKLRDRRVGGISVYLDRYATPAAMLDAIADKTELADELAGVLALAFLVIYLPQVRNTTRDLVGEEAEAAERELDSAVRALADTMPYLMGWNARPGGRGRGGALASTMSTYDY